jgi:hypothetical protein
MCIFILTWGNVGPDVKLPDVPSFWVHCPIDIVAIWHKALDRTVRCPLACRSGGGGGGGGDSGDCDDEGCGDDDNHSGNDERAAAAAAAGSAPRGEVFRSQGISVFEDAADAVHGWTVEASPKPLPLMNPDCLESGTLKHTLVASLFFHIQVVSIVIE